MTAVNLDLVPITCCVSDCGLTFGVPRAWYRTRKRDHTWWHCPNGHRQHWPKGSSTEDRLRDELREAQTRASRERQRCCALRTAMTRPLREASERAKRYRSNPGAKGAFWAGYRAMEAGEPEDACPYDRGRTNAFRRAWLDGHGSLR